MLMSSWILAIIGEHWVDTNNFEYWQPEIVGGEHLSSSILTFMTTDLKQCALQARVVTCIKANGAEGRRLYARILGFEMRVDKISRVARFLYFTIFVLRTNASCLLFNLTSNWSSYSGTCGCRAWNGLRQTHTDCLMDGYGIVWTW